MGTIDRLMLRFGGLESAYGSFIPGVGGAGKRKGVARTLRGEITPELWQRHLDGVEGLGIVPIKEDNTCVWGVVDVDIYNLDHADIILSIEKSRLPLVVCRSKSGGAHLFLFVTEPVDAEFMQQKLRGFAAGLGYGSSEIFPKQITINVERGDVGNWLNMPYFNAAETTRFGYSEKASPLELEEFLDYVDNRAVTPDQLEQLNLAESSNDGPLVDGPCCLESMTDRGVGEGGRNIVLYNVGIAFKKKYENWEQEVERYNRRYLLPPLPSAEVVDLLKRLRKKTYNYDCKKSPLVDHCNPGVCRTRRFGVAPDDQMPVVSGLRKIDVDDPIWFLDLEGHGQVELSTTQLMNYNELVKAVLEQQNMIMPTMTTRDWRQLLRPHVDSLHIIEMSDQEKRDSSTIGQFSSLVEEFCVDGQQADEREEILLGRPYTENNRTHFRLSDLTEFLNRKQFRAYTRPKMTQALRSMGATTAHLRVAGRPINVWMIDEFDQSESIDLPDMGEEEVF